MTKQHSVRFITIIIGDLGAVLLNIAFLLLYNILTSLILTFWWVGYTIGSWIMIAQLTLIILIKYYQMYYKVRSALNIPNLTTL